MRYAIVIEKAPSNYSVYCPDLPRCVATGNTIEEVKKEMTEAMPKARCADAFHLEGLVSEELPIPLSLLAIKS